MLFKTLILIRHPSEKIDLQSIIQLKEAFDEADLDGGGKLEQDEVKLFKSNFKQILVLTFIWQNPP